MNVKFQYIWINNFDYPVHVKTHSHKCYEIVYYEEATGYSNCFSGNIKIDKDVNEDIIYITSKNNISPNNVIEFHDSSLVFVNKGDVHDEIHSKPAKLIAIGFHLQHSFPFDFVSKVYDDNNGIIHSLFKQIVQEYTKKENLYISAIEKYIELIIIEMIRMDNLYLNTINPIINIKSYLSDYFATDIDLDTLAQLSGYSIEHFRYLFKKETGMSPKQFVLEKRYNLALKLLEDSDISLNAIASMCGYDDYAQFSTFFKKKSKMSPIQYRKNVLTKK